MTGLGLTLLVALGAALVLGALAHRLRLPPMLGYIGTGMGLVLGWELIEALFVGGAVSVASTVVLVKVAGEATLHTTAHGRIALGVSPSMAKDERVSLV